MTFESTELFYEVRNSTIQRGPYDRPSGFGESSPDSTLATYGHYRLWVDHGGASPGPFYSRQAGEVLVDEVSVPARCTRTDVWVDISPEAKRTRHLSTIDFQRLDMDRLQIDVRNDPGAVGLMDEANVAAAQKIQELGATDDGSLDAFDPTLNPRGADSISLAASLARQERAILASANPFTEQQRSDLAQAATQHEAIVDAGDPQAVVPEVPSFARRMVGVMGEDVGTAFARRIQDGGWWWLELGLKIDRELDPSEYWFAVYDETAPEDRDDTTTGYLTTPKLTKVADGEYLADRMAVNLPTLTADPVYRFTLCRNHISNPQFDKMTIGAGLLFEEYRVRWHGLV